MAIIKTVKIKDSGKRGFKVINACGFDKTKHSLFTEPAAKKPAAKKESKK